MMIRRTLIRIAAFGLVLAAAACSSSPRYDKVLEDNAGQRAAKTNTQLAIGYLDKGDTEIALEKIQRALSHDRNSAEAHTVAAIIYERIGQESRAEEHYGHAVRLSPNDGNTLNNYGQLLCKVNRVDDAIKYFDRAVSEPFYKTPEVAHTNAGACLEKTGKLELAERRYRDALDANEKYPDALYLMSRSMCSRGEDFRARAFLQRLVSVVGESAESLWLCVVIENRLGDRQKADECAKALKSGYPESNQARRLLEGNGNNGTCG